MSISVIIPAYNREHTLKRALNSVLEQTIPVEEIIVVDDGSTDNTQTLIKNNYPGITFLKQKRQGVSSARNRGIQHAKGEWLAFLDSDDAWLPSKIDAQWMALEQSNFRYPLVHTDEIWYRNGIFVNPMKKHKKFGGWIFKHCLPLCVISPSSTLIHREVFHRIGEFDETLPACEDYDLWLRITAYYPALYVSQKLTLKYGGHEDQLSRQFWGMDRFRIYALDKILQNPELEEENRIAARAMLEYKIRIFIRGSLKRGKTRDIENYENLLQKYTVGY